MVHKYDNSDGMLVNVRRVVIVALKWCRNIMVVIYDGDCKSSRDFDGEMVQRHDNSDGMIVNVRRVVIVALNRLRNMMIMI